MITMGWDNNGEKVLYFRKLAARDFFDITYLKSINGVWRYLKSPLIRTDQKE